MKIMPCMCSFSFSLSNSTYLSPFIVVLLLFLPSLSFIYLLLLIVFYSNVRWNEIETSSATARHDIPNHLARRLLHCRYNIFLVKTLTQWPPNVHVARYKLLHGAFVRTQHFLPLSESPMAMTSGKVQSPFLHQCEHCQCILTVRHILVECNHFAREKKYIFGRRDVVESFRE